MPRKGRGGARQGTLGTAYGNRTDLNVPIATVPGQEYGKASQQRDAQSAVPMASSPQPQMSAAPAQPRPQVAAPGSLPTYEPTMRPNEPVTHGMPFGPGGGPEVLTPNYPTLGNMLQNAAGNGTGSSLSIMLASAAKSLGL